jgi:hypothetical protein
MIHFGRILLIATISISNTSLANELLQGELRGIGEMVVINGKEYPDLVDQFDLIKNRTVMIRGTVFAKDINENPIIPAEFKEETEKILAENDEKRLELERERTKQILAKGMNNQTCLCNYCSLSSCMTVHSGGLCGLCKYGDGCGQCAAEHCAAKPCGPECNK